MTINIHNNNSSLRSGIGTLKEKSLHAALIQWFANPGDKFEIDVNGYIIDIVRDKLLFEIQTKNFSAIKDKLFSLCKEHQLQLIHPIARQKWIVKKEITGETIGRRKSPKRGRVEDVFTELIRIPRLISSPNFSLFVVLIDINEIWKNDGKGSWRRKKWSIADRHLLDVIETYEFYQPKDFLNLLPPSLPKTFTNKEVSSSLGISKSLAGKMTYCLRKMNEVKIIGKRGRANLFSYNK
jgi:hypothetical protein